MYNEIKINATEEYAVRIIADATELVKKDGIEGYAMMWLNLTNNQRENRQDILKIYNDSGNKIYIVCNEEEENVVSVKDYLKRLGLVIELEEKVVSVMTEGIIRDDDLEVEIIGTDYYL